jgi:predicted nucleotidyltransferase
MTVDVAERRREHVALLESELARIVEELRALGASLIVLFGSYAQGRRDLFTDLDIVAVMDSDTPFVMRHGETYAKLRPKVDADIVVYTPEEFDEMKRRPFVRHALTTGKVLHARP